jgi:hypothetical protein
LPFRREERLGRLARAFDPFTIITPRGVRLLPVVVLANPDIGVTQIAHRLGVSPATLYRYIPAARTANTPGV